LYFCMKTQGKITIFRYSKYFTKFISMPLNPDSNSVRTDPKLFRNENIAFKYVT